MRPLILTVAFIGITIIIAALVPAVTMLFASPIDQCGVAFPCHVASSPQTDTYIDLSHGTAAGHRNGAVVMPTGVRSNKDFIIYLHSDHATAKADVQAWVASHYPGAVVQMLPNEDMAPTEQVMRPPKAPAP